MAWITKNSATMEIDRREEPYLTEAMKADLSDRILPRYAEKAGALLPVLHAVQESNDGWLPYQALIEVAEYLDLAPADVLDAATFYEEFHLQPVGKVTIGVCQSIACEVCGHEAIVDHLRRRLGIEPGETTEDGLFTLRVMECLGACDAAPCALVNEHRHDRLTIESVDQVIDETQARLGGETEGPSDSA